MKKLPLLLIVALIFSCKKDDNSPAFVQETIVEKKDKAIKSTAYVYTHSINVVSLGFKGFKTVDLYAEEYLVLQEKPDLIIIQCGTNEVLQNDYINFRKALAKLIDDLKVSKADIVLLSPPPLVNFYSSLNPLIINITDVVKSISIEKTCFFVDINAVFNNVQNYANLLLETDGIHPTANGYSVYATEILKTYVNGKMSKNKIVCFGDSITYGPFVTGEGTAIGDTYPGQLSYFLN